MQAKTRRDALNYCTIPPYFKKYSILLFDESDSVNYTNIEIAVDNIKNLFNFFHVDSEHFVSNISFTSFLFPLGPMTN